MGAHFDKTTHVYWSDELKAIAKWLDARFPQDRCPEPLDIQMRHLAARLRAIASEPRRSRDGDRLQGTVEWVSLDITDHFDCTGEEAEDFLDEIEDELQLAMIETGWRIIRDRCEFQPLDDD